MNPFISVARKMVRALGVDLVRYPQREALPTDLDDEALRLVRMARPFSLTTAHRLASTLEAVRHVCRADVPGDIVECGVWRGGNMLLAATTLKSLGDTARDIYLYDTFEGMTAPSEMDRDYLGTPAQALLKREVRGAGVWCEASLEDVQRTMGLSSYPAERIHYVRGPVEQTIPGAAPEKIAVLRLDTDWFESTRHEMEHLFPRLSPGGILIIDDYGHWQGARRAVDEYLDDHGVKALLVRVDYTCRIMVKDAASTPAVPA